LLRQWRHDSVFLSVKSLVFGMGCSSVATMKGAEARVLLSFATIPSRSSPIYNGLNSHVFYL
jgi:hypothetical protein